MQTIFHSYAAFGLVGSLKQVDSGGSECPLPMIVPKSPGEISSLTRPKTNMPRGETLHQKHGKILRDAVGNVVGIEMLGDDSYTGENSEEGEGDLADAAEVSDMKPTTNVINGMSHMVG